VTVGVLVGVAEPDEEEARAPRGQVLERDARGVAIGAVVGVPRGGTGVRRVVEEPRGAWVDAQAVARRAAFTTCL
jgi:hypothetical protein